MDNWIKVEDELPQKSCEIIVYSKVHGVVCGYYEKHTAHYKHPEVYVARKRKSTRFIAWQPLPKYSCKD